MRKIYLLCMILFAFTGFTMAQTMENFESLKMNLMLSENGDLSSLTVVPNPDPTGINLSSYVVEFVRDKDGVPWGGFYATLPTAMDFAVNKYVHVKVWKSRISPVKFKIERADGNIEVASMNTQTVVNGWEDFVFDFSTAKAGEYSKIVFMPDFLDPVALTSDITLYYDDFLVNNNPNPISTPEQTIHVDMNGADLAGGDPVYISGALGGIYGTWNEPGKNENNEMTDPDGDGIYSITLNLPDGTIAFKFFKGIGWGGGDPATGGDRTAIVAGNMELTYEYGVKELVSETHDENISLENFESLKMNLMKGEDADESHFAVIPNPAQSGLNLSSYVVEFNRDKDGLVWGGFYATLDTPVDFTTNKYVHVKVWKPRASIVKFKIEGGVTGDIEIPSMNEQTLVEEWEDMVFDFTAATGPYSKIVFMPDYNDPVDLPQDMTIYFDDFVLNDISTPFEIGEQVINVDMKNSGMTAGSKIWISGALGGVYGTWSAPGSIEENEMKDVDGDGIYSTTLQLADGDIAFKFFWGTGWDHGDTAPGGDRTYVVNGSTELDYIWGIQGLTSSQQLSGASFKLFPNPVTNMLTIESADMKGLVVSDLLGRSVKNYKFSAVNSKQVDMSDLQSGIYLISVETSKGISTSKFIKN